MDCAIAIAVVANGAIQKVVAENPIKCFALRLSCYRGVRRDTHVAPNGSGAGSHKLAIDFDHAGVTRLNWTKLLVITDLGQLHTLAVYYI